MREFRAGLGMLAKQIHRYGLQGCRTCGVNKIGDLGHASVLAAYQIIR